MLAIATHGQQPRKGGWVSNKHTFEGNFNIDLFVFCYALHRNIEQDEIFFCWTFNAKNIFYHRCGSKNVGGNRYAIMYIPLE